MKIQCTNKKIFELTKNAVWKTASLFIVTCFMSMDAQAQYTAIPDTYFEKALVDLGIDTVNGDHQVLTSAVSGLTSLDVNKKFIKDLTGISSFTSLKTLHVEGNVLTSLNLSGLTALTDLQCDGNKLTSLDLSGLTALYRLTCPDNQLTSLNLSGCTSLYFFNSINNKLTSLNLNGCTALTSMYCSTNQLTTLNLSGLTALKGIWCDYNQLTTLNLSGLTALLNLYCKYNKLTSLDLSGSTALFSLDCRGNLLTSLNLSGLTNLDTFEGRNNSNLNCILVDDKDYADYYWSGTKDATASFATNCSVLGTEAVVFEKMSIYPNPTKGELHIDNVTLEQATVYDALGKLVHSACFDNVSDNNTLSLGSLGKGNYYIFIEAEGLSTAKQLIVE